VNSDWRRAAPPFILQITNHQPPPTTMSIDRRDFVGRLAAGALLAGMPMSPEASALYERSQFSALRAEDWDLSWVKRIT